MSSVPIGRTAWRWICGVKPKPKVVNKPSHHSIRPELDKPGVFTTVSEFTLFDVTQHSIQLIQLHLSDMHSPEEVARKGSQLLGGLDEPLQHRVRVHLEHASCCPDAEPLSQARQYADQQLRTPACHARACH